MGPEDSLHRRVCDALIRAFREPAELRELFVGLGGELGDASDIERAVQALGRLPDLVVAARARRPADPALFTLAAELLLVPFTSGRLELQQMVRPRNRMQDPMLLVSRLSRIVHQVCRIEVGPDRCGTGFLVGADLLLTNQHVIRAVGDECEPSDVVLRFDYRRDPEGRVFEGVTYRLAAKWLEDVSPPSAQDTWEVPADPATNEELDYALLRVAGTPGLDAPSGPAIHTAAMRGWIAWRPLRLKVGDPLEIVQHPRGLPVMLARDSAGVLALDPPHRIRYATNTEPGSSGSPCFDADWDLIAMHHVGDPAEAGPQFNQGIPLELIAERIRRTVGLELQSPPPPDPTIPTSSLLLAEPDPPMPPAESTARRTFLVVPAERGPVVREIEQALRRFVHLRRMAVIARRLVTSETAHTHPVHARIAHADLAIVVVDRGLSGSDYLASDELEALLQRQTEGRLTLIVVTLDRATLIGTRLDGRDEVRIDATMELEPLVKRIDALLDLRPTGAAPNLSLDSDARSAYLAALRVQLEQNRLVSAERFVEPDKVVIEPEVRAVVPARRVASVKAIPPPRRSTRREIEQLLGNPTRPLLVAILGAPGSGKSVLLHRLATQACVAADRDPQAPVPILVRLRTWGCDADESLLEMLNRHLREGPPDMRALARRLEGLVAKGRLLILLDGLDELPRPWFAQRVARIRQFATSGSGCQVVVACRLDDFPGPAELNPVRIEVQPLDERRIEECLEKWGDRWEHDARAVARRLLASDHPASRDIRNAHYLSLWAEYTVRRGSEPTAVAEPFDAFVDRRLLEQLGATDISGFRADLGLMAHQMASDGIGAALPSPQVLERMRGWSHEPPNAVMDVAISSRLVRRDEATGSLAFDLVRVQELLLASHLATVPAEERDSWLRAHLDDPWSEEIFVLLARQGISFASFAAWVVAETRNTLATSLGYRREDELARCDLRLRVLGRVAEAGALEPEAAQELARLLADLWQVVDRRDVPARAQLAVMRAARGRIVDDPLTPVIERAMRSRRGAVKREAWSAMASRGRAHDLATIRRSMVRQAVTTNYTIQHRLDRAAVRADARLRFAAPLPDLTLALHLLLLVVSSASIFLFVYSQAPSIPVIALFFTGLWMLFNVVSATFSRDGMPSSFRVAATLGTLCTTTLLTLGGVMYGAAAIDRLLGQPDLRVVSLVDWEDTLIVLGFFMFAGLFLSLFSVTRRLLDSFERAVLMGVVIGACLYGGITLSEEAIPRWALASSGGIALATVIVILARARRIFGRELLVILFVGAALAVAVAAEQADLAVHLDSGIVASAGWLLAFATIAALLYLIASAFFHNARVLKSRLIRGPCTLIEARGHIESLMDGSLFANGRRQAMVRLADVTPYSRVLELALAGLARTPRWQEDDVLPKTVETLSVRRQRGVAMVATLDEELEVAAAIGVITAPVPARARADWFETLSEVEQIELRRRAVSGDENAKAVFVAHEGRVSMGRTEAR